MKKKYKKPFTECSELIERYGILKGDSGEAPPDTSLGKESTFVWNDEVEDLWGDEPEEGK